MTTTELNAALKRLKAVSDSLIDCDEKIAELSSTLSDCAGKLEKTAYELNMAKNLVAVKYCPDCINCTSTLKGGQKCKLSKRVVGNSDYCSKYVACPDSLCWDCKNAVGGCEWSQSFTPVDGWEAIPRTIGNEDSFCVIKCPKFVED